MHDREIEELMGGYEAWLIDNDYAPSTIRQSIIDAKQIVRHCLDERQPPPPARLWESGRRLAKFMATFGATPDDLGPRFDHLCSDASRRTAERERGNRKLEAHSLDSESWRELFALVQADNSFEARVLEVMMLTGLRIGDVFSFERSAVRRGLQTGTFTFLQKGRRQRTYRVGPDSPLRPALTRMMEAGLRSSPTAMDVLAAKYNTAYRKVDRKLKRIARDLPGRAHSHRLRRTVAIRALEHTKNPVEVAKLLGHRSVKTTMGYLDEEDPDKVADLQDQLHKEFLK